MKYFFVAEEPSMGLPLASQEESGLKTLVNEVVTQAASTGQKKRQKEILSKMNKSRRYQVEKYSTMHGHSASAKILIQGEQCEGIWFKVLSRTV